MTFQDSQTLGKFNPAAVKDLARSIIDAQSTFCTERREIEGLQGQLTAAVQATKEELSAAYQRIAQLETALGECRDYFEDCSDVIDGSNGEPAPNREIRMLIEIDEVLL
jgi:hypothetical protein